MINNITNCGDEHRNRPHILNGLQEKSVNHVLQEIYTRQIPVFSLMREDDNFHGISYEKNMFFLQTRSFENSSDRHSVNRVVDGIQIYKSDIRYRCRFLYIEECILLSVFSQVC